VWSILGLPWGRSVEFLRPAPVAQWRKSLAAVGLAYVATRLWRSRLRRLVSTCRSTESIFRD